VGRNLAWFLATGQTFQIQKVAVGLQEGFDTTAAEPAAGWSLRWLSEGTSSAEIREVFKEDNRLTDLAGCLVQYIHEWEAVASATAPDDAASSGEPWWCLLTQTVLKCLQTCGVTQRLVRAMLHWAPI